MFEKLKLFLLKKLVPADEALKTTPEVWAWSRGYIAGVAKGWSQCKAPDIEEE